MILFIQLVKVTAQDIPQPTASDITTEITAKAAEGNDAVKQYLQQTLGSCYNPGIECLNKNISDKNIRLPQTDHLASEKEEVEDQLTDECVQKLVTGDQDAITTVASSVADYCAMVARTPGVS